MIAEEDLKFQALDGSPIALVECLTLLKTDVARSPEQRPPIFAEFLAWGLFPAILNIDKAPPESQVDRAFWCERLRLLPVRLAVQIILAGTKIPAENDEKPLHADVWPGVLRWIIFIARLDDDACQSLDPSVLKLVAALGRDLLEFLAREPQLRVCQSDPEGTQKLRASLVRLVFFCPAELWSKHVYWILEGLYFFHRQPLPLDLASQVAGLSVIGISKQVEDARGPDLQFQDRFLVLRLLLSEDQPLGRQLNEKHYTHWLVASMRCTAKAVQCALQPHLIDNYAFGVDHILYCIKKLVSWVGIPAASEILTSGFLDVVSSPGFQVLMEWDVRKGRRDADHDMIGLQNHVKQILESMQKFLVWQSFIRTIRRPIAAFVRSQTYKAHLHSQEVRTFLEIAVIRQSVRDDYIRRCSNKAVL